MSDRKHCDTCDQEIGDWDARITVRSGGQGVLTLPGSDAYGRLTGDYCSITCLTRKMQSATPTARAEMYAGLDIQESTP